MPLHREPQNPRQRYWVPRRTGDVILRPLAEHPHACARIFILSKHSFRTAAKVPMPALSGSDRSSTTASKDELRNWFKPDVRSSDRCRSKEPGLDRLLSI